MQNPLKNILQRFFPAGWLERPPVNFADDGWYGSSPAGMSRTKALTVGAVFRAVNLISGYVGKLPCFTYRYEDDGKSRAANDPSYSLARWKWAQNISALHGRQTLTAHALLQGGGFAYIVRETNPSSQWQGRPKEIVPLHPDQTHPRKNASGETVYLTRINDRDHTIAAENILHIRGLGFDGLNGYSVIQFAATSLGLAKGAQEHGENFFKHGTALSGVLETPEVLDEPAIQRLRTQWQKLYGGVKNHHKPAVLEQGLKYAPVSLNAADSQLIETMQFTFRDVANWFGVPPHKLGDNSRTAYNSLEQENQAFLDDALDYWLVVWEQEMREKLLSERQKDRDSHFIEFERKALVRADLKTRAMYYKMATGGRPWMTPDEVRGKENVNTLGGDAAKLIDPTNNFDATKKEPAPEPKPKDDEESKSLAIKTLEQAQTRMIKRLQTHAKKTDDIPAFLASVADGTSKHRAVIDEAINPAADLVGRLTDNPDARADALKSIMEAAHYEN